MKRLKTFNFQEFADTFRKSDPMQKRFDFQGISLKRRSQRYELFCRDNGATCISCGLSIGYMALEQLKEETPHLNAYGTDPDGNEVLFTKDHITPVSRGGKNHMSNYQTMCRICNEKKGNKILDKV